MDQKELFRGDQIMEIQCIATDLDGTLLNNNGQIFEYTKKIIDQLIELGVEVIPSTARAFSDLPTSLMDTKIRYFICSNGAMIYDRKNETLLFSYELNTTIAKEILEKIKGCDKVITIVKNGIVYSSEVIQDVLRFQNIKETDIERICKTRKLVKSVDPYLNEFDTLDKLHLNFYTPEQRISCLKMIPDSKDYVCASSGLNIEITHPLATKGHAILEICEFLKLDSKKIIAFGDNLNDSALFEVAQIKVAMKNAKEELKLQADVITEKDNQEEGVAHYLSELFHL